MGTQGDISAVPARRFELAERVRLEFLSRGENASVIPVTTDDGQHYAVTVVTAAKIEQWVAFGCVF
jgi:hypothetical protein